MTEPVEAHCPNCSAVVTFDDRPDYTTSKWYGAKLYVTLSD
jgi:hypothetical protein